MGRKYSNRFLAFVQFSCSVVFDSATPWITAFQASLSITNSWNLPKLIKEFTHQVDDAIHSSHPLSSPSPPAPNPSIRVFSTESTLLMRWPMYWSFNFSIHPSNEHPGLISFRMDRLDLLAVQGTLKNLLQHHSSKALILWHSAFFTAQLSHPYMTTGKTLGLTRQTFVGKVMSLPLWAFIKAMILPFQGNSSPPWYSSTSGMLIIRIWMRWWECTKGPSRKT